METMEAMDMMLAKKRSADRKKWLEVEGDMADVS
jgi:topoisomerase-4 subunit B